MKKNIVFVTVVLLCISFLIAPILSFFAGMLLGWIVKIIMGNLVVSGAAALGLTITKDSIPLIFGLFGLLSGLFNSPSYSSQRRER